MKTEQPQWQGVSRTNYVRVKDLTGLLESLEPFGIDIYSKEKEGEQVTVLYVGGVWPDHPVRVRKSLKHELDCYYTTFDPQKHVLPYLFPNQVLVMMTVAHDSLHELKGEALAFHTDGRVLYMNLESIYDQVAKEFDLYFDDSDRVRN